MKKALGFLNIITLIGTLAINGISSGNTFSDKTVGEISDSYPTLFAPAGYTFSVWGIIYLALLGFVIFQARDLFNKRPINLDFRDQIGPWFILSNVFNMAWIIAWVNEYIGLALLLMLALLGSLLIIYLKLGIGKRAVTAPVKWFVHVPFSIYLGWICVATIANVSALLVDLKWSGLGLPAEIWTGLMILVAGVLAAFLGIKRKDIALRGVVIWALIGVYVKISGLNFPEGKYLIWTIGLSIFLIVVSFVNDFTANKQLAKQ